MVNPSLSTESIAGITLNFMLLFICYCYYATETETSSNHCTIWIESYFKNYISSTYFKCLFYFQTFYPLFFSAIFLEKEVENADEIKEFDKNYDLHRWLSTSVQYVLKYYEKATRNDDYEQEIKPYVFLIDEINRGEISKILGELFFSIDPGYRGKSGALSTQYSNLHEGDDKFYIPENVYIIGTMNDIDRSVDSFDFAMRRRFRFIEIKADERLEMLDSLGDKKEEAIRQMTALNHSIAEVDELNENYHIGASYFLKLDKINSDQLWNEYLQPLLHDYIRGMYEEDNIMRKFSEAYRCVDSQSGNDDDRT